MAAEDRLLHNGVTCPERTLARLSSKDDSGPSMVYWHIYQIQVSGILQLVQRQRPFTQERVKYFKNKQSTGPSILEDDKDAGMLKWRLLYPVQISDTLQ